MRIRRLSEKDLQTRVEWMNDARVYRNMHFTPPILLDKTIDWYQKNLYNDKRQDVVFEAEDGSLLAMGGLTGIDYSVRKAEFYIFVNPNMLGKGIGTEATWLLCKYGFDVLQLHKIYLFTNASNIGASKTYQKVGFKLEGVLRDEMVNADNYEDRLYYGLLSSDFKNNREYLNFSSFARPLLEDIRIGNRDIKIVRDDLIQQAGGGVKSRKSMYYECFMRRNCLNACVTTGGVQSNHNRAIALMCAKNGWRCHIVYHGTRERFEQEKGNAHLVRKSGASYEFVEANQISEAMDSAIDYLKKDGYNPYYIHGGGHDLSGGIALVDAVKMLQEQCEAISYKPDYIFHASGTGSTQAGLAVGLDLVGWSDVKLIGISVARQKERGTQVIEDFANNLAQYYGLDKNYKGLIDFNTDYLCGGYENFTPEMNGFLDQVMKDTGVPFDTTYSGKALYGMNDYLDKNKVSGNVLFWHTGGLMNMMK